MLKVTGQTVQKCSTVEERHRGKEGNSLVYKIELLAEEKN